MRFATSLVLGSLASLAHGWTTYTVAHTDGADDAAPLIAALATGQYSTNTTILFAKGITYNIWKSIKFPKFTNVEVSIQGNLSYPTDIPTIQAHVASSAYAGAWFYFNGGTNVTLHGSTNANWGWVDGHGQQWWTANNQVNRPHGWRWNNINGGSIYNMKLWKPIGWNFAISGGGNNHIYNNQILSLSDDPVKAFPFNTDGFGCSGPNILLENNHIENGDDCFTVTSGAINVTFRNGYCEGGHGLSIGSLGSGGATANVQNILAENVQMVNTLYGARFKAYAGGKGLARNVTWSKITFTKTRFPIYITQNYYDQETGPPKNAGSSNTDIADFSFKNFQGTINDDPNYFEGSCVSDPCWYAVPGATGKEVIILDLHSGTETDVLAKKISATTVSGAQVAVMCDPDSVTGDLGFVCHDGPYIADIKGS